MSQYLRLPAGKDRFVISEALRLVVDAAEFDAHAGYIDVFVEVASDENGNEAAKEDGRLEVVLKDGKQRALEMAESTFLEFCKAEGVSPRDPCAPWTNDYAGTPLQNRLYRITDEELKSFAAVYGVDVLHSTEAPPAVEPVAGNKEAQGEGQDGSIAAENELAALFEPVSPEALVKMFKGDWKTWAERAARNGLDKAREGRRKFNPYLAAHWWLNKQTPDGWDLARVHRTLANNLPDRSLDSKHLLTGELE